MVLELVTHELVSGGSHSGAPFNSVAVTLHFTQWSRIDRYDANHPAGSPPTQGYGDGCGVINGSSGIAMRVASLLRTEPAPLLTTTW